MLISVSYVQCGYL